jgi:glycosyltransferase involved in cell wall biosynthesis
VIITIVTPSLNGIDYLRECIESVRSQQTATVTVEHILVDGGSTDGTPELARALGATVLTREEESPYAALNKGSFAASGTLIGSIGCDDIMLPGALEEVARRYEQTKATWLVGRSRWFNERGARGVVKPPPAWMTGEMLASLGWSCVPQIATFFHRDLYADIGGYDASYMHSGDYDLFVRLLLRGERFVPIDRCLCAWRMRPTSISTAPSPRRDAENARIRTQYAPASLGRRTLYRFLLKVWLNGTNPRWFAYKRLDGTRTRLNAIRSTAPTRVRGDSLSG